MSSQCHSPAPALLFQHPVRAPPCAALTPPFTPSGGVSRLSVPFAALGQTRAGVIRAMAPEHKIPLGMAETPIEPWFIPGIPSDVTVHIKRGGHRHPIPNVHATHPV